MTPEEELDALTETYVDTAKRVNNDIRELGNQVSELLTEATKLKGIMATPEQIAGVQSIVNGLNGLDLPMPIVVPDAEPEPPAPKAKFVSPAGAAPHAASPKKH